MTVIAQPKKAIKRKTDGDDSDDGSNAADSHSRKHISSDHKEKVLLSKDSREIIKTILRGNKAEVAALGSQSESSTVQKQTNSIEIVRRERTVLLTRKSIQEWLVGLGFQSRDARDALLHNPPPPDALGSGGGVSDVYKSKVLDWMYLNVPEDDCPAELRGRASLEVLDFSAPVNQDQVWARAEAKAAEIAHNQAQKEIAEKLSTAYLFETRDCELAVEECKGDETAALGRLLRWRGLALPRKSADEIHDFDAEMAEEDRAGEREALAAIFDKQFNNSGGDSDLRIAVWEGSVGPGREKRTVWLRAVFEENSKYPEEPPLIVLLDERKKDSEGRFQSGPLHKMFRELNKKAADLCCGAPILHELVEWAKDTLLPSYAIVRKKDKTDEPKKSKREPKKSKAQLEAERAAAAEAERVRVAQERMEERRRQIRAEEEEKQKKKMARMETLKKILADEEAKKERAARRARLVASATSVPPRAPSADFLRLALPKKYATALGQSLASDLDSGEPYLSARALLLLSARQIIPHVRKVLPGAQTHKHRKRVAKLLSTFKISADGSRIEEVKSEDATGGEAGQELLHLIETEGTGEETDENAINFSANLGFAADDSKGDGKVVPLIGRMPSEWVSKRKKVSKRLEDGFKRQKRTRAYQRHQKQRSGLPSHSLKTEIVRLVQENQVVVISGATGCGKSTQVRSCSDNILNPKPLFLTLNPLFLTLALYSLFLFSEP